MTSWSIHTFLVLVDPHPFYCIKMVWIDQNKKGCGSTKTSLTVHAVGSKNQPLTSEKKMRLFFSFRYQKFRVRVNHTIKVNRDRYNIDAPRCNKKAYKDFDFRALNGIERFSESILNFS